MVEWIEQKIMKKIAGWLDGQKKYKDGWMEKKKCMDQKKNGWIKQIDRWLDGWI